MKTGIIIPARYQSSRYPGKPLIKLGDKTMIEWVYKRCEDAIGDGSVWVASDDERIFDHCKEKNLAFIKTSNSCLTGTDRVYEAARELGLDLVINVQGDEPLVLPEDISRVIEVSKKSPGVVCNGYCKIENEDDFLSLTVPKVVFSPDGKLLYMSRAGIPGNKDGQFNIGFKQVCIYSFPIDLLEHFYNHGKKTMLESIEDIEILRFIELGYEVKMVRVSGSSLAVDTPEDQKKVIKALKKRGEISE
jgi:3-deoxy-manno-octulosonate cytidylyltransferase (CMP-KDO synthetase)